MINKKIDWDFYEYVIIYNALLDRSYLTSVLPHIDPKYFNNADIKTVFKVISEFFENRGEIPTTTEIKTYLVTTDDKNSFKSVVSKFDDISKNLNTQELYENTEQFLKERAVYTTMMEVAESSSKSEMDTSEVYEKFDKACNISLLTDHGHDYFEDIDKHIDDLITVDGTIPSRWDWLDEKIGGGFLEQGRALYIFAGETNIGKSIFLGNIATNIARQKKTVLLVTLEMSELMY